MKTTTFSEVLKEYLVIGALSLKDQKTYYLIQRYESKVSKALIVKKQDLIKKAHVLFDEYMDRPSFLLSKLNFINKGQDWIFPIKLK